MPKRPQAPKPIFPRRKPTFKIYFEKGLDSEDADRRDSMVFFLSGHSVERVKSYIRKRFFFLAKWQDPEKCNLQA